MNSELEVILKIKRGTGTNEWKVDILCGEAIDRRSYDSLGLLARDLQDSVASILVRGCVDVVARMREQISMENLQKQYGSKEINPHLIKKNV